MNNEPVAWMLLRNEVCVELTEWFGVMRGWEEFLGDNEKIVELYTHPHPDNLGLAESIIKQKEIQIRGLIELLRKEQGD